MKLPIYLDWNATTPVEREAYVAMEPYYGEVFGNPASEDHEFGWRAKEAVDKSRKQVATFLGAKEREVVFTSGATESINLAIKGSVDPNKKNHIVTTVAEHQAVLVTCDYLEKFGVLVTRLKVDRNALVDVDELESTLLENPASLVSVIYANNETGSVNDIDKISQICKKHRVPLHLDAAQSVGKIPFDLSDPEFAGVSYLSFSGHKMRAPKGVGVLIVREPITPQIHGGGHERGFRSGTLNVPHIVGLGKMCEIYKNGLPSEMVSHRKLKTFLWNEISKKIPDVKLNSPLETKNSLPNTLNVCFKGVEAESLMLATKEICVSSGSACASALSKPSHVLKAMGLSNEDATSSIRFSLGKTNSEEELAYVVSRYREAVSQLRALSSEK